MVISSLSSVDCDALTRVACDAAKLPSSSHSPAASRNFVVGESLSDYRGRHGRTQRSAQKMEILTMRRITALALVLAAVCWMSTSGEAAPAKDAMIGHMVYFQLNDNSPAAVAKMVAACDKYLKGHPGEVFYASGSLAKEMNRPVNDRDWDVALHLVFKSKADLDKYAEAPRHLQFIDENKTGWKKVRVFDSLIEGK
jgi:Stress responsive A/B Barrel Domain